VKWIAGSLMWLAVLLLPNVVLAQSSSFVLITPDTVNMVIGESRTFRLVDQNGRMQGNVAWTISDRGAFQVDEGEELFITAKHTGDFRIEARSAGGSAEAAVKVMEGTTLPIGTAKWSAGTIDGCKGTHVVPAVPSASGVDVFQQSECRDGSYVSAYTADGIMVWRHKISASGEPVAANAPVTGESRTKTVGAGGQLNLRSRSFCDAVVVGTDQRTVRGLLDQQKLSFREDAPGERAWIVEESSAQCKLWFDEKLVLSKKRKMFVSE
jgi:hypothetical protein